MGENESDSESNNQDEEAMISPQITTKRQRKKSLKSMEKQNKNEKKVECDQVDEIIAIATNESAEEADDEDDEHYEVEYVVKARKSLKKSHPKYDDAGDRCYEYFVKWKGWDSSTNTWEHQESLGNCTKLIDAFWAEKERQKAEKEKIKKQQQQQKK